MNDGIDLDAMTDDPQLTPPGPRFTRIQDADVNVPSHRLQ